MDFLQQLQERYIQEFSNNVPLGEFLVNLLTAAVLTTLLQYYYLYFGQSLSNRRRFAHNFLPLALGTLLVIMIVKSSIALSLGLVGALSIVRFRAAIKDPEELVFLFIAIGIGLACGANQPLLAMVALSCILLLLWLGQYVSRRRHTGTGHLMVLNISTDLDDLERITQTIIRHLPYASLKRLDALDKGLDLSFSVSADTPAQLDALQKELRQLSPATRLSIIEQPELLL